MSLTSVFNNARGNIAVRISSRNVLTLKLGQKTLIRLLESSRVTKPVNFTSAAEIGLAVGVSGGIGGGEELAIDGIFDGGVDVLEDISFSEDVAAFADFEGVAGVVVPVVVDLHRRYH